MTYNRSNSARRSQGFTLPEVLMAMLLLTIGLTSILMLFPLGARMQVDAVNDTSGRLYAESALAALHANANYLANGGSPVLNAATMDPTNNPTALTPILSNTPGLPTVPAPSGNYQYRACFWQTSANHYSAAVFAFNASSGIADLVNPVSGTVLNANNGGLTQLNVGIPPGFSQDQTVLVQDITLVNAPVFIEHVADVSGGRLTVTPAMPVVNNDNILLIYLPQRALAVATGSIR